MDDPVVITAVASGEVDTAELWRAHAAGAEGRRDVNKWTHELPERIAELAGRALAGAGADPAATGCVVGSVYGSGHVAETIRARLDAGARSSLAPESFVYFNAHGVTSLICLRHGLGGHCATILGPGAGLQALAAGRRGLRRAADAPVLCGAYEMLSPAAARALGTEPVTGWAAFLVLETAARARGRGARVLARLGPVETYAPPGAPPADVRATAPLAALAAALTGDDAAAEVTVAAAGRRHGYRCTAHREE
ncbi:3-oxoacyl-ACP synthase [Streptomyces sp. I05A-00742]|uniref:3-oxoacyl-ACP synthase n=1 Tax=Streptomyces sp. I05A-00742 TaxID=2732853 RepID=UPI001487D33E|nr:3-oxoacyl-ACP synthase [Streptomyces sp. I05A-00742]